MEMLAAEAPVVVYSSQPEMELLLCCARVRLDARQAARLRGLLSAQPDWEKLRRLAGAHGLQPLLYHHLRACWQEFVPGAQWQMCREHYRANAIRNHFLAGELVQLLELFAAHGITAIPFKGPALAADVYGDLALRRFCDLDIIVRREDVARAKELLAAREYRLQPHSPPAREAEHLRYLYHHLFVRASDGAAVELHWAVSRSYFGFPFAEMKCWERLGSLRLAGAQVPTLAPEDLLLLLCVHGAKHLWEKLEWICGVAELTRVYPQLDWARTLAQAQRLRSERLLLLGLRLADNLLGAALPDKVRAQCQDDAVLDELVVRVRARLFAEQAEPVSVPAKHSFLLKAKDSLADRLRYLWLYLITPGPPEWHMVTLPSRLTFLYRGLRLLRLVWIYGWILIRLCKRDSSLTVREGRADAPKPSRTVGLWSRFLLLRMAMWIVVLSLLIRVWPLARVLRLLSPRRVAVSRRYAPACLAAMIDRLLNLNRWVFTPTCWKRAIILHRYLALNGVATRIIFGVRRTDARLLDGHAWLEVDGEPLLEARRPDYHITYSFPE